MDANEFFHHPTCPYHLEQNSLAERKHRHLVEIWLTFLAQSSLPTSYFVEAFHTANYIINRLPTRILHHISPYEKLFHKPPQYSFFKFFGCACYPCVCIIIVIIIITTTIGPIQFPLKLSLQQTKDAISPQDQVQSHSPLHQPNTSSQQLTSQRPISLYTQNHSHKPHCALFLINGLQNKAPL